jgi:hypothetical protein
MKPSEHHDLTLYNGEAACQEVVELMVALERLERDLAALDRSKPHVAKMMEQLAVCRSALALALEKLEGAVVRLYPPDQA